jgi:hypothetical protein
MSAPATLRAALAAQGRHPGLAPLAVPIPANPRYNPSQVVWNGDNNVSPAPADPVPSPAASGAAKYITITNASAATIYPFLRTANNGIDPHSTGPYPDGYYDPKDPHNQEFRLYVGYTVPNGNAGGGQYLGLPAGATITFQVPLVFWDGDNLFFSTEGAYITSPSTVYNYRVGAKIAIGTTAPSPDDGTTWVDAAKSGGYAPGVSPIVMFYHDTTPLAVSTEALAQLGEMTFRDPYLTHFINDPAQTFPLINYDISFVNNLVAPGAMEANDVPIYYVDTNQKPVFYGKKNYGWTGSNHNAQDFGKLTQLFIRNQGKARIGKYFGGHGWPQYYNPDNTPNYYNIPSGYNIFSDSPLNTQSPIQIHRSGYDQNHWNLSSANGNAPIQAGGAGVGFQGFVNPPNHPNTPNRIYLTIPAGSSFGSDINQMIQAGAVNIALTSAPQTVLGQATQFVNAPNGPYVIYKGTNGVPITTPPSGAVFQFTRTASDYAITAITNLWYSWANYNVQQHQGFADLPLSGTTTTSGVPGQTFVTNKIHFTRPLSATIFGGMTVKADDLPDGTTVVKVVDTADGGSDVYLSRIPTDVAAPPQAHTFTFGKPLPLPYDPRYTQPYTLSFKPSTNGKPTNAQLFAASVYSAMAAMAKVPNPTNSPYLPASMNLVEQVIGFNQDFNDQNDAGYDLLVASIRDVVKSILRGVYDFYQVPNQSQWYPNPAFPTSDLTSGQPFNVYNLDPYVWFVHQVQQLNAYGFSLDDDVANPGAGGPRADAQGNTYHAPYSLQMQFNGTNRLTNTNEWFPTIPWGILATTATIDLYQGGEPTYQGKPAITILNPPNSPDPNYRYAVYQMINNPGDGQLGAYVYAPNNPGLIPIGTTLVWKAGLFPGQNPQIVMQPPPGQTIQTTSTPIAIIITANLPTAPPLAPIGARAGRG